MGRATERETKAQPRAVKTGKVRTGGAAQQSQSRHDSTHAAQTDVRKAQTALNQQGFYVGDPDGKLGQRTKKALITFQKQHGVEATGKVDRATLQALDAGVPGAGAAKASAIKDANQKRGPAPPATAPQNPTAAPGTTGQGAPATTWPADSETSPQRDGLQNNLPDFGGRVPAGAPQENYKDDTLPSSEGDQRR
jgi:peptidoglycan hydrolase-like protein with peptidoglycan-binding domain